MEPTIDGFNSTSSFNNVASIIPNTPMSNWSTAGRQNQSPGIINHLETPKRPTDSTPLIQATWKAKESTPSHDRTSTSTIVEQKLRQTPVSGTPTGKHVHVFSEGNVGIGFSAGAGSRARNISSVSLKSTDQSSCSGSNKLFLHGNNSPRRIQRERLVGGSISSSSSSEISSSASASTSSMQPPPPQKSSSKMNSTPNQASLSTKRPPIFNPFESAVDLIESMNCSSLSPSVFSTVLTPSKEMSWGVGNIAILYPTDIEENADQETPSKVMDPEMEERLQSAIDSFFAQKSIAPSPWLVDEPKSCPLESSKVSSSPGHAADFDPLQSCAKTVKQANGRCLKATTKDVRCQTVLSIPVDLDLERILGSYFTFNENQSSAENLQPSDEDAERSSLSESRDGLSVSSLRRKLFVNYEDSPRSPPRIDSRVRHSHDPIFQFNLSPRTPDRVNTPTIAASSTTQFSSSPIGMMFITECNHYARTSPIDKTSPTVSPIKCFKTNHDESDCARAKEDDCSFMSIGRARSRTPTENVRRDVCDNMSVVGVEDPEANPSVEDYNWVPPSSRLQTNAIETTKMSFMDIESNAADESPLAMTKNASNQDFGYQTMSVDEKIKIQASENITDPSSIVPKQMWPPNVTSMHTVSINVEVS